MSELFVPRVGAVVSADIAVPEYERELRFYSHVLSTGENPLWCEDDLTNNLGMPIIGLGERTADYAHLPVHWMPHIQVADVATSVRRALDLGGSVLMHEQSQWAVLLDPNGAAFGIIPVVPAQAVSSSGGSLRPDAAMGQIYWLDLTVSDASKIRDFYHHVVEWSVEDIEMTDGSEHYVDYAMLGEDGAPIAGICHARGVNAGLPPVWMIYLPVGDLAGSLHHVEKDGGKVVQTMRGEHTYAVIQDPVGAYLALMPG